MIEICCHYLTTGLIVDVLRCSVDAYSGSPPGVQPYIDEVPFAVMSSTPLYDLDNVQTVKGARKARSSGATRPVVRCYFKHNH